MPILLAVTVLILLLFVYWSLWIRALGWVLRKAGFGEVPWSKKVGIFVCTSIAGALFNRVPSPTVDGRVITIVWIVLSAAIGAILFLLIVRLFLGGPILSKRGGKAYLWYLVLNLAISIPIFLLVIGARTYIVAPFQMNGQAMSPTLQHGEYIMVNKWDHSYARGDIVVLEPPLDHKTYYVERIIGLPGETVIFDGNRVVISNTEHPQGFALNESYLRCMEGGTNNCSYSGLSRTQYVIPEGAYFVMGDNRMNSTDSRFCFSTCSDPAATPFLPAQNIIGKVASVIWPLEVGKMIEAPEYFAAPITVR